jgi:hypothetical protein
MRVIETFAEQEPKATLRTTFRAMEGVVTDEATIRREE